MNRRPWATRSPSIVRQRRPSRRQLQPTREIPSMTLRVTVWNEYRHEREDDAMRAIYPEGMHTAIATGLGKESDFAVRTATLDEPEHGLTQEILDATDVV